MTNHLSHTVGRITSMNFLKIALFFGGCLSAGCSGSSSDNAALTGGVTGAAVGAGTGALIGSAMSNGNVGQSALVGGAIGIPVGIVAGLAIHEIGQADDRNELDSAIEKNTDRIVSNQHEIETIRQEVTAEQASIHVSDERAGYVYDGPTIGNPRR